MAQVFACCRSVAVVGLLAVACAEPPPVAEQAQQVEPEAPAAAPVDDKIVAVTEPPQEDVPWRPAWPVEGGVVVPAVGQVATGKEVLSTGPGARCGDGLRVDRPGAVVWLPEGAAPELPVAPAVLAAAVERVSWRLGEVLGPSEGIVPGGRAESDPARHQGATVRTVRKTRRMGPPVLVVIGERRGKVAAMITDRDGAEVLAAVVFEVPGPPWPTSGALPIVDLDGDGALDLVVYGEAEDGRAYRASLAADLGAEPALRLRRVDSSPPLSCP